MRDGRYVQGDKVLYYGAYFGPKEADVLRISAKGRLSLNVHQGGAVPYYTATGVKPESVCILEHSKDYALSEE